MLGLGAAACAWSGTGGALRARPRLHQASQTANDARLHTLGAVHRAARHAAPLAQSPALLTDDDQKVLASLRAAGLGNQTGFAKSKEESNTLDFVFRGHASGARPGSYVAGSMASQCYTGGPAQQACDVAQGASQSAEEPPLVPRCVYPAGQSLPRQIKGITISQMVSASERRWYAIFKECDVDDDDSISRREPQGDRTQLGSRAAHSCSQLRACAPSFSLRPGCPPLSASAHPPRTSDPAPLPVLLKASSWSY